MNRCRRASGFSLIEVCCLIAALSVGLVATAGAVTGGAQVERSASEARAALRAEQTLVERIRATSFTDIAATFHERTFPMSELNDGESTGRCVVTVRSLETGSTKWPMLEVTVTSSWTGVQGSSSQSMVTQVCDRMNGAAR